MQLCNFPKRFLYLAFLLPTLLFADSVVTTNGVVVTDYSLGEGSWYFGSHLTRLHLRNPTAFPQKIDISCGEAGKYSISSIRTSTVVQPGGQSIVEWSNSMSHGYGGINIIGIKDSSGYSVDLITNGAFSRWRENPTVYATPATKPHALKEYTSATNKFEDLNFTLSTAYADPWPADFRAYGRFAACLLTLDEFYRLPETTQTALYDYAAAGGVLCLFGAEGRPLPPHPFQHLAHDSAVLALPQASAEDLVHTGETQLLALLENIQKTADRTNTESYDKRSRGPYPGELRAKPTFVGGVYAVLLLFAILAGPVLIVRLARRNQRLKILWILPALSAAFCLLLTLVFFATNGVRPTFQREAVTLLDQTAGRALTTARLCALSPFTPRRALDFPRDAILFAPDHTAIDIGATQRIAGRWAKPGVVSTFHTRTIAPTHLRLEVTRADNGTLSVRNLLGETIDTLFLWDENGQTYSLSQLAPGATATLTASALPSSHSLLNVRFQEAGPPRPATFAAELSGCPFTEDPTSGPAHRTAHAYVFGSY